MIVLDKFRGGRELVPGRELVHHHYMYIKIAVDIRIIDLARDTLCCYAG